MNLLQFKKIPLPEGFKRVGVEKNSFAEWLQNIPLKKDKTVYLFDRSEERRVGKECW